MWPTIPPLGSPGISVGFIWKPNPPLAAATPAERRDTVVADFVRYFVRGRPHRVPLEGLGHEESRGARGRYCRQICPPTAPRGRPRPCLGRTDTRVVERKI